MHPWETEYATGRFYIATSTPSVIVKKSLEYLGETGRVADIGCGQGRNTVYLAERGFQVDASDVADLRWVEKLPSEIRQRVHFRQRAVEDLKIETDIYDAIFLPRLIQYLPVASLDGLMHYCHRSLKSDGILAISYTVAGGIHQIPRYKVKKYSHPVENIKRLLGGRFLILSCDRGAARSKYVPHEKPIESYDIIARKV
jgi:2-polyprenyl-3-methyl-5-hydroxy-6-metoxy-1,4-benzoquinol methylase